MERVKTIPLILAILGLLLGCYQKEELIFAASDELHFIGLYKKENRFRILYNGFNTAVGSFVLRGDSILLDYDESQFRNFNANDQLTKLLVIDSQLNRIRSVDGHRKFCAEIYLDNR